MNTTQHIGILQLWQVVQLELLPELRSEVGSVTPKLEKMVHTLEWVRIKEFIGSTCRGCGRPEHDRGMLANAFVSKGNCSGGVIRLKSIRFHKAKFFPAILLKSNMLTVKLT